jgi:hypothetical protein
MKIIHRHNVRTFTLVRKQDISGVSGTGVVAEGAVFACGKAVLVWLTEVNSVAVYDSVQALEEIHGHGGATHVVFDVDVPAEVIREKIEAISAAALEADAKRYQFADERGHDVRQAKTYREHFEDALCNHAPSSEFGKYKLLSPEGKTQEEFEQQVRTVYMATLDEVGGDPLLLLKIVQKYKDVMNL